MSFVDLGQMFQHAVKHFPDLMEPYVIRIADFDDQPTQERIMRQAMAETIRRRYPLAGEGA